MHLLTLVDGLKTFVRSIDFLDFSNSAFRIRLTGTSTANRVLNLPDDTGTFSLDDRPIGTQNAGVSLRGYEPIVTVTATRTLSMTDAGTVQNCINAAAAIVTIPLNSAVAFPIGTRIIVRRTTAQAVTIDWSVGVTVLNSLGSTLTVTGVTSTTILRKTGTDSWIAFPDLPESAIGGAIRTAVDATTGRSTLGLGTISTQNASAVNITGGTLSGVSTGNTASVDGFATLARGVWIGVHSNTARAIFSDGTNTAWTIDSEFGNFRWYTPDVLRLLLRASDSLLQSYGPIAAKVYTPATRPSASSLPAGTYIFIFDATFTPSIFIAYTDATNWYRVSGTTSLP